MKKEEKTKRTYEKILAAAIVEFGTKSYADASLTTICKENQIPKGLLYHNFKGKDDLYLRCVEACFHTMTEYLRETDEETGTAQDSIRNLLHRRHQFFQENLYYSNIFFGTVLQPPQHLQKEIREIRREFDEFSGSRQREILAKVQLRDGITTDMALEYFLIFQEMFNGYFQSKINETEDFHALIENHEVNLSRILDIMLYGICRQE